MRGFKPVAPDCGTSKASPLPGPGSAALLGLRPRRGSYQWLSHVTRRPAAAKPKAIQALGRCTPQGAIRFCSQACLPASVLFRADSGAGFGRREPQPAPRLGSNPLAAEAAPAFQPLTPDPGPTLYLGRASPPLTHTHKSLHPKVRKPSTRQRAGQ